MEPEKRDPGNEFEGVPGRKRQAGFFLGFQANTKIFESGIQQ